MGKRIIKKENGLFAVWETVCDNFLMDDVTQEVMIETLSEWAKEEVKENLEMQFRHKLYIYTDYKERCKLRDEIHKEISAEKVKNKDEEDF